MSGRWRRALAGLVLAAGIWMVSAGSAWGSYAVNPTCVVGGQTVACGSAWYVNPVQVYWTWSPNDGSVVFGCITQSYAKDTSTSVTCDVSGSAGETRVQQPINIEISNPSTTALPSRPPDSDGWYNHPVAVAFQGSAFSGIASCSSTTSYAGPDTQGTTVSGTCVDNAGKTASASLGLQYDSTPPTITSATPSRRPDRNGWYNHPVSFSFSGSDAISGINGCGSVTYGGPASAGAVLTGDCTDRAGNIATRTVQIRYDATPAPLAVRADAGDGSVIVAWRTGADAAPVTSIEVVRAPGLNGSKPSVVYHGRAGSFRDQRVRNGVRYRYSVIARDQAGNTSARSLAATPGARLLSPSQGAQLSSPPLLRWTAVPGASYYNVQLYRGAKILSAWPVKARLQLARSWSFRGHRYRLKPGRYHWYVWPGFGSRSISLYGRLIGSGTFVVSSPAS